VDEEHVMNDRIERLKGDAAELKVGRSAGRDGLYQTAGAVAMGAGVLLAFLAYQMSLGQDDSRDIQSLQILAVAMLALSVVGAAVFLRYSLARFLRFWLLRQLYEGQAHIDQVVAALGERGPGAPPAASGGTAGAGVAGSGDEAGGRTATGNSDELV
jgi:hypothetical protein